VIVFQKSLDGIAKCVVEYVFISTSKHVRERHTKHEDAKVGKHTKMKNSSGLAESEENPTCMPC
jgi:hypothetical protein